MDTQEMEQQYCEDNHCKKCGLFHGLIGIINEQQELINQLIDERPKTENTKEIKDALNRIIGKTETVRNQAGFFALGPGELD